MVMHAFLWIIIIVIYYYNDYEDRGQGVKGVLTCENVATVTLEKWPNLFSLGF